MIEDMWDWLQEYWFVVFSVLLLGVFTWTLANTILQEPERCENIGNELQIQTKYVEGDCYLLSDGGWIKESDDSADNFVLPFVLGLTLGSAGK